MEAHIEHIMVLRYQTYLTFEMPVEENAAILHMWPY